MPVINALTFSKDYIIDKLVAHFNNQSEARRTIAATDIPFFNVKVVTDDEDKPTLVIGNSATSKPITQYAGEATFVWVGPRGIPVVAEPSHFFEISKYISNKTTHVTGTLFGTYVRMSGVANIGGDHPETLTFNPALPTTKKPYTVRVMLTDAHGDGWNTSNITITVNGVPYEGTLSATAFENITQMAYVDVYVEEFDTVKIDGFADSTQFPEENGVIVTQFSTNLGPDADPDFITITEISAGNFGTGEIVPEFTVPYTI